MCSSSFPAVTVLLLLSKDPSNCFIYCRHYKVEKSEKKVGKKKKNK